MLFAIPYPTPYLENHFGIGYPYLMNSLKSNMDTLIRIRRWFWCGNGPIRLHPYIQSWELGVVSKMQGHE
jgi:hypothetical protein